MENLIKNSLVKAITYTEYRDLIKTLLSQGKSTGKIQNDEMLNYSKLNDKRMDRLDKKLKLNNKTEKFIEQFDTNVTFLTIAEGWCGDAAQVLPMIHKIAETSSNINFKLVLRDENDPLMEMFLTNGGKAIPKIIILDSNNKVINTFGPRPSIATQMVLEYKNAHGSLDADFKKDLQLWYNKDKGENTQNDLIEILKST